MQEWKNSLKGNSKWKTPGRAPAWALGGAGLIGLLAIIVQSPAAQDWVLRFLAQQGAGFVFALALLYIGYQWAPRILSTYQQHVAATERLSGAVERIAQRDDTFQRAQEALLGRVARQQAEIQSELHGMKVTLEEHLERSVKFAPIPTKSGRPGGLESGLKKLETKRRGRKNTRAH